MIISPDNHLYNAQGLYEWNPDRSKAAWGKAYSKLTKALLSGKFEKVIMMGGIPASGKSTYLSKFGKDPDVIYFDATFTNKWVRGTVLDIVVETAPETPVEMIFLDTPKDVCLQRNSERTPDRRVPPDAYDRMCGALAKQGFPSKAEGFDKITIIRQ